jgi:alpha-ketoglutarate-dependent taurine dioxygenase
MAVAWRTLAPAFGAEVKELDITEPLSPETTQEPLKLWNARDLLRFRGESPSA